jgi:oligopeptide/dipeptide ABC transporter ATP-binding protein
MLQVDDLRVTYATAAGALRAVDGVSLQVAAGETVGLVGESGCGKSTLGRAILGLEPVSGGRVLLDGTDIVSLRGPALRRMRAQVQMVFQDPYGSLNPRRQVGTILAQPLLIAGRGRAAADARVLALLRQVGLAEDAAARYPHEFSGGQRQRIGIARALALSPRLIVCDEPVSALDVSVRAQIINLLNDLQAELSISYLFISHDLSVVEHVCDRVLVMYLGRLVESGDRATLWQRPLHPYTRALLAAAPIADPVRARARVRQPLSGELPSPLRPSPGCAFHTRCPMVQDRCRADAPVLRPAGAGAMVACHFADTGAAA